jgi:hypothetical protein
MVIVISTTRIEVLGARGSDAGSDGVSESVARYGPVALAGDRPSGTAIRALAPGGRQSANRRGPHIPRARLPSLLGLPTGAPLTGMAPVGRFHWRVASRNPPRGLERRGSSSGSALCRHSRTCLNTKVAGGAPSSPPRLMSWGRGGARPQLRPPSPRSQSCYRDVTKPFKGAKVTRGLSLVGARAFRAGRDLRPPHPAHPTARGRRLWV